MRSRLRTGEDFLHVPAIRFELAWSGTADLRSRFAEIACPVLLLMGERDTLVPLAAGRQAAQLLADAQVRVIAGSGHAPFIAQPRQVAAVLEEFLQPVRTRPAGEVHGD